MTRDVPAYALDGGRAGAADRVDVPVRRAAARQPARAACQRVRHRRTIACGRCGTRHVARSLTRAPARRAVTAPMSAIALVGCGRISRNHFEAIAQGRGPASSSRSCDVVEQRAREAGERERRSVVHRVRGDARRRASRDVVAICTPSGLHPQHGIAGGKRRASTSSREKPMAISLAAADELVQACDAAGVHLFVVKQNRLNPPIQLLKRAVDKGRFGRIYMANATVRWTRPQEYYDQAPWRGTWEFDGGAFMNQASHYVDLIQWLVGPGGERDGEDGDAGAPHRDRGLRRRRAEVPLRRARRHRGDDAHLSAEPRGIDHAARREGHGEDRRHGGEQGRALGVRRLRRRRQARSRRRTPTRRTSTASATRGTTATCWRCCAARRSPKPMAARAESRSS